MLFKAYAATMGQCFLADMMNHQRVHVRTRSIIKLAMKVALEVTRFCQALMNRFNLKKFDLRDAQILHGWPWLVRC